MAPPPANLPLAERLKALAQTLQYVPVSASLSSRGKASNCQIAVLTAYITTGLPGLLGMSNRWTSPKHPFHGPRDRITDLQFSHLTLLLSVFRYTLSFIFFNYYSSAARISYRLAFISAAVTYGIVVYKGHFARGVSGSVPQIVTKLISDENVQYLGE